MCRVALVVLPILIVLAVAVDAGAVEPEDVSGIQRPAREEGDAAKEVANALLFIPRNTVDLLFAGTTAAASLIQDEQLVPRYQELLGGTKDTEVYVFPTLFAETQGPFSVGMRMIVDSEYVATSQRVGVGGLHDLAMESRIQFIGRRYIPFVINIEGLYELASDLEYHGVGVEPEYDDRNRFVSDNPHRIGLYQERKVRGIASIGLRFLDSFEFFLSSSLTRRQIRDSDDSGSEALSRVFQVGTPSVGEGDISIPNEGDNTWIFYAEMAARFDSRPTRGTPSPGVLLEAYTGGAQSTEGDDFAFMRIGWRAAVFLPIYRRTNILTLKVLADNLLPLNGLPIPFTELSRQPDFRGFDTHRDRLSMVGTIEYSWSLVPFMGMRLFVDGASVASGVSDLSVEHIRNLRYATGIGVDLYTDTSSLAQLALTGSPEGARLLLTVGIPPSYGDRQHRD